MIRFGEVDVSAVDFATLCKIVDEQCIGDVFLITAEGDRLNLKSKLCQLIGLSNVFSHAEIAVATLKCTNPKDEEVLFRYNLYRKID